MPRSDLYILTFTREETKHLSSEDSDFCDRVPAYDEKYRPHDCGGSRRGLLCQQLVAGGIKDDRPA
jgi:hypothetical protein